MKTKCTLCNVDKGKRGCVKHNKTLICPKCCAQNRDSECGACSYYREAEHYHENRSSKIKSKPFIAEFNPDAEKAVNKVIELIESGHFQKAEEELMRLFTLYPNNHSVYYAMGCLFALRGEQEKAIVNFKKSIEIFPYFAQAHYNLAVAHKLELNIREMIISLQKAVRFGNPDDYFYQPAKELLDSVEQRLRETEGVDLDTYVKNHGQFNQAVDLMEKREWEKAIQLFEYLKRTSKDTPQVHGNLGICYAKQGKREKALTAFDKALELDPEYELALVNRKLTESLSEGDTLNGDVMVTNYYKEYIAKNKSYIRDLIDETSTKKRIA